MTYLLNNEVHLPGTVDLVVFVRFYFTREQIRELKNIAQIIIIIMLLYL